ncbi:coronin-7 isoform X1 [Neodiprion virginianus]|uniref:coronin-7 isoform X1 n=1 Tax=Neodiprion fabricii TaxID=2872261 RepID=UPI001ED908B4|nr:coronin-7 isoform X1 [Neodiprion fabricii]XP_046424249.1 coronin-7 isoform X1 [Neodiprion fabricii]XP_046424250.1 coronin-7 isoform X1 [Neodiprion fabricii]XP_046616007.1 coronin-7 isoform X1 [Neodiprion virginianus]XP_046616008.1 coronin-7 isoform X1 [Neodiprion virginianus]XP_046616009.1 coronin-7 isoform X1 [Neodiprion virginianus]
MAWRFKASKYKNAAPVVPKPEACIRDISVGSYQTYGNNIAASAAFMAFNVDHNGSSLAVLPLDDCGRKSKTMPLLHAHTDTVTDMDFSPFHDGLLATGSQDCLVKLWHIPEAGLEESLCNPECTFSHRQRRVEAVRWHPTAEHLLTTVSYTNLSLWDVISQQELFSNNEHAEVIQSLSWKQDGTLLATSCKDKQVRIIDPRSSRCIVNTSPSHQSIKDSRIVWLGDKDRILTTGFDSARLRQVYIRDLRNLSEPVKTLELDCSTGILMPLFDPDTNMLFLAGKGDTTILYMEVTEREPHLVEGIRHSGEQTKGGCLVPKRALNVMQAEVNRLLQLTSNMVIPIMYQVPRKTYRDFHADIYPDTAGCVAQNTAAAWIKGHDAPVPKISLDPSKREKGEDPVTVHKGNLTTLKENHQEIQVEQPKSSKTITITAPKGYSKLQSVVQENDKKIDLDIRQCEEIIQSEIEDEESKIQNGSQTIPPKPLPRASRANSISEEDPKPVARPRTTPNPGCVVTPVNPNAVGGYKPRLGPKPFQAKSGSQEFSFDKVFSVPVAPNTESNGHPTDTSCSADSNTEADKSPTSETEQVKESENGKSDSSSMEEDANSSDSGYKPKTPSTAERRKLFETKVKDESPENEESGNFERGNVNRNSIAERRRLYESRSVSVTDGNLAEKAMGSPTPLRRRDSFKAKSDVIKEDEVKKIIPVLRQQSMDPRLEKPEPVTTPTPKRTSTVFGRVSKFRHLKGTPGHKSTHIENIRNISRQISGECDGFHANPDRVAVPLSGPGGKIAVLELKKTGRLADGVMPALVHGATVMDFQWDPFNNQQLAVACDDGMIRLWEIPPTGLEEPTNEPRSTIEAHADKIYLIKFHPLASNVLASASYDMTVKIWDLTPLQSGESAVAKITLTGHTDQIFSLAWSPCGQYLASACKDGKLRVYKPRDGDTPIREGKGPVGTRGARVVWALDGRFLVVMGFDKVSERQIIVFKADNLNSPLNTVGLDVSPAILMPYYDEDSSTLFLTGRGDSTIYAFEVTEEAPYCCPLSHHRCASLHQGLSFLPKNRCDVTIVEFAAALRLTNNTIEPLSFTVPRIKSELFQDDLFPPTRVTWSPTVSAAEWFGKANKQAPRISLKPPGMDSLTESQGQGVVTAPVSAKQSTASTTPFVGATQPFNRLGWNPDLAGQTKAKQEEIQKSVSNVMGDIVHRSLEQDHMEGVDEREWDE